MPRRARCSSRPAAPRCCAPPTSTRTCPAGCAARGKGWVTAEYSMLPGASPERIRREVAKGSPSGRTQEIQRLIGRSLRGVCDMVALGERQVIVDCDVLQADGGTRTASITGGYLALHDALTRLVQAGVIRRAPAHRGVRRHLGRHRRRQPGARPALRRGLRRRGRHERRHDRERPLRRGAGHRRGHELQPRRARRHARRSPRAASPS